MSYLNWQDGLSVILGLGNVYDVTLYVFVGVSRLCYKD